MSSMKLNATIGDYQTDVTIRREGSRAVAEVGGRRYELDAHEPAPNSYLLIADGRVSECRLEGKPESGQPLGILVGGRHYIVTLTDPKRLRGSASAGLHSDGAARVIAPMPGKVVRVLVDVGAQIEAGEGIVIVEAMKMQNEMKSPTSGTVVALNVRAGATVNGGDVLAVIG